MTVSEVPYDFGSKSAAPPIVTEKTQVNNTP